MKLYRIDTGRTSKEPFPGAPFEMSTKPIGDPYKSPGVDVNFLVTDACRTWSDGQQDLVVGYYKQIQVPKELKGHDICSYCGADNGAHGEHRVGFNCWLCGGN